MRFERQQDGSYKSPSGMRATLTKNLSTGLYELKWNQTGERMDFHPETAGAQAGRLQKHLDENGNLISFQYNADGNATQITDTQGRVTTLGYGTGSTSEVVTSITDAAGRVHSFGYYTGAGRPFLVQYQNPAGETTSFNWLFPYYLVTEVIDPRGNKTILEYDLPSRRLTKITHDDPAATIDPNTTFTYLAGTTEVRDENTNLTTYFWDSDGRVTEVRDALGNRVLGTYTANSDLDDVTLASGIPGNKKFDNSWSAGLHNLEEAKLPTNSSSKWEYNDQNHRFYATKAIDPQNNPTTFDYHPTSGNVTKITNALGRFADFDYFPNGNVRWAKDFKGNVAVAPACAPEQVTECFEYFPNGNLQKQTTPLGATSYTYDSANRVATVTDPKGQVTSFEYDGVDRLKKVTYHGGATITYVYDGAGNVTSMADSTGTTTYEYDFRNRLTKETLPDLTEITYTYDAASNLLSTTNPSGQTNFVYDSRNLLTSRSGLGGTVNFVYDVDHFRTETRYPGGVTMFFRYDDAKRLIEVEGKRVGAGVTLTKFTYDYRNGQGADTGLRQSVTDKDGNKTSFTYDPLNRLVRAEQKTSAGSFLEGWAYAYDENSNRCRARTLTSSADQTPANCTDQYPNTVNYTHNAADQLLTAGSTTFTYDLNGNETEASGIRTAETYNTKDQLTSITPQGQSAIAMNYSGQGQFERVTRGGTSFLTGALGLNRETTAGATTSFTRDDVGLLLGMRIGTANHFFLYDGLGSVVAVTDAAGNLAASYKYEPFGKDTCLAGCTLQNPYRFLGGLGVYLDSQTQLYKMGTRYYDPALGRFTQVDPVEGGSANRYDYAFQDPINNMDPTGQLCMGWRCGIENVKRAAKGTYRQLRRANRFVGRQVRRVTHDERVIVALSATAALGIGCYHGGKKSGEFMLRKRAGRLVMRDPRLAGLTILVGCVVGSADVVHEQTTGGGH